MIRVILSQQKPFQSKQKNNDDAAMSEFRQLIPEEWTSAVQTLASLNRAAGPLSESYPRSLITFLLPFALGIIPGWLLMPKLSVATDAEASLAMNVMAGLLAFGGLVVGFVVTLMLFTGRVDVRPSLSYEILDAYVRRIKYLLASQAMTLFASLVMSSLTVAWMVMRSIGMSSMSLVIVGAVLSGFVLVVLSRVFLLPIQIYELHEAWLGDVLDEKREETNRQYKRD